MVNGVLKPAKEEITLDTLVLPHSAHYGLGVFEGTRAYLTEDGRLAFVALNEHNARLIRSQHYQGLDAEIPSETDFDRIREKAGREWGKLSGAFEEPLDADRVEAARYKRTAEELNASNIELVLAEISSGNINPANGIYIRTLLSRGFRHDTTSEGVFSAYHNPLELTIVWEWPKYLGQKGFEQGIAVRIDEERKDPKSKDFQNKLVQNYSTNQRGKNNARMHRFNEAIYLDRDGYLLEGSGENIILLTKNGILITPRRSDQPILDGITVNIVEQLARNLGYTVVNDDKIDYNKLFSDEIVGAVFTGTACEVTPIQLIYDPATENIKVFDVPEQLKILQREYMNMVTGREVHPKNRDLQKQLLTYVKLR